MKAAIFLFAFLQVFAIGVAAHSGVLNDDGTAKPAPAKRDVEFPAHPSLTTYSRGLLERQVTNGERLRKRMPLLPPTRRSQALHPRASSGGGPCGAGQIGKLAVYDATGTVKIGYISKTFDGQNSYTRTADATQALIVQLPAGASQPFEFVATNGPDQVYTKVGFVGGSGGYNFKSGQLGYAYMAGTGSTPAGSAPSRSVGNSIQTLGYNGPSESTVYSINCATRQLSTTWINTDSTSSAGNFFYDGAVDFIGIVGDYAKFVQTFPGENSVLQTLFFEYAQ